MGLGGLISQQGGSIVANSQFFWPGQEERSLLGRFYLASSLSEAMNVVFPFQFIYLYLVMERPEWAVIPTLVETIAVWLMEVPTGMVADRWGRKLSVISGDFLSGLSWLAIPMAVSFRGLLQLYAVCVCFFLEGIGQTLVSGAEEAWVVDNLASAGREDMVERYFARIRSFGSLGGAFAGGFSLLLLLLSRVDQHILNLLWYLAACGQLTSVGISLTIPEHQPPADEEDQAATRPKIDEPDCCVPFFDQARQGFSAIFHFQPLFSFFLALVVSSFAGSITGEAFEISLLTKGLDARGLAPLDIISDLTGMVVPLLAVAISQWLGATASLILFSLISAAVVSLFFTRPGLWLAVVICLVFNIIDDLWDPIADARLQSLIPSSCRATAASIINQAKELANSAGIGAFALLLGRHSEELRQATPDLIEAFSGGVSTMPQVPKGLFGLPIPDLALVLFTFVGLVAIPLLIHSQRGSYRVLDESRAHPDERHKSACQEEEI